MDVNTDIYFPNINLKYISDFRQNSFWGFVDWSVSPTIPKSTLSVGQVRWRYQIVHDGLPTQLKPYSHCCLRLNLSGSDCVIGKWVQKDKRINTSPGERSNVESQYIGSREVNDEI
jgi:hypothetical protein